MKVDVMLKHFSLNVFVLPLSKRHVIKGSSCCFTDHVMKLYLWLILLNTTFWFWSRWLRHWFKVTRMQEWEIYEPSISHVYCWFKLNVVCFWDLLVRWTSSLNLSDPIYIQRRRPFLGDFIERKKSWFVIKQLQIIFPNRWTPPHSIVRYHFAWLWPSFKVSVVWESKICTQFLTNFSIIQVEIWYLLPQPAGLLKFMQNLFHMICIHESELFLGNFTENTNRCLWPNFF